MPYVRANKNDRKDAQGIAEAVTRPDMKFVPIKKIEQQDILLLHRARELTVKQRTAQANQIRGLLAEYGVIIAKGISHIGKMIKILEDNKDRLTTKAQEIFGRLYEQFKVYDAQVRIYDKEINQIAEQNAMCEEIMKISGIGALAATAIMATIGDARAFKNGREVSIWVRISA